MSGLEHTLFEDDPYSYFLEEVLKKFLAATDGPEAQDYLNAFLKALAPLSRKIKYDAVFVLQQLAASYRSEEPFRSPESIEIPTGEIEEPTEIPGS